jgi:quercetin dioxygenase-like cupin family protein
MTWHAEEDSGAELSLAEMTIRAGSTSPPHRHADCEERLYVRDGTVTLVVDGERRALAAGDSARIPRKAAHHVVAALHGDATLVLVWSTAHREYEALPPGG